MNEQDFRAAAQAKKILASHLRPGMTAVDATCGNGNDSLFLAALTGPDGALYACDIQPVAVETTARRLEEAGYREGVHVFRMDHARFDEPGVLPDQADCFMYNLGYLPGSDHAVRTQAKSTLLSLRAALSRLAPGGIITLCLYPHNPEEIEAVRGWCRELTGEFSAFEVERLNRHQPPVLIVIVREDHDE